LQFASLEPTVFSAKKAHLVIPVSQNMCPFSHGRAHFGGFSAHELNGQDMGRMQRTNHRLLHSAHPILQDMGSKKMGCAVKANRIREG